MAKSPLLMLTSHFCWLNHHFCWLNHFCRSNHHVCWLNQYFCWSNHQSCPTGAIWGPSPYKFQDEDRHPAATATLLARQRDRGCVQFMGTITFRWWFLVGEILWLWLWLSWSLALSLLLSGPLSLSLYTSSTAQGGGGSCKNGKPIGEIGCCESRMAEQIHWWSERWLELCFLEWLQRLQWSPGRSPHPQLLDVVWCSAAVVVVVV